MNARLPFIVSFCCVLLFAGLVVASPDYSPLRDAIPFAPGAASSSIIPTPTDTHDLGSATNAWREINVSGDVISRTGSSRLNAFGSWVANGSQVHTLSSAGAGVTLRFGNYGRIANVVSDGTFLLTNNAATDFGLLQFGGTTSAFPALQRTGTGLRVYTADAGANGDFSAGNFTSYSGSTRILSFGQTEGGMSIGSASALNWTSGVDAVATAPDIGLARNAAGVLRITNGSTGVGNLLMDDLIQFGGTTSGFASIRAEAGPSIGIKNADNSSYIPMTSSRFNALSGATVKIDANPAAGFMLANDQAIRMSSGADARIDTDSGIARHAVGTVRITDGSTGYGQITGRIVNSVSATPTEPYACAAATAGGMVYVDDTNDTAVSRMCFCGTTADDTTYDWLQVNDPTAACPSF